MNAEKASTMRSFILLLAVLCWIPSLRAQGKGYQGDLGGSIGVGLPMGEFADAWGDEMLAFGARITLPARRIPLQFGLAFGYGTMGKDARSVMVADPVLAATEGRLSVKAKVLGYHPFLRLSPSKGKVRPYAEALAGVRQFTTHSKVTVDGLDAPLSKVRHANDFVLSTGWAAGLMVGLGGSGYIEARAERLYSGPARYVDPASIAIDPHGEVLLGTLESPTGMLSIMLGVGLRF